MNTTIREARNALSLQVCAAFFIALILLLPTTIQAQWTTPDANQNINNTNSGNVGVKTTTPEFPLQVNGSTGNILGLLYTGSLSVSSGAGIQSLTSTGPSAADQRLGFYTFGARSGGTSYNPIAIQGFSSQAWTDADRSVGASRHRNHDSIWSVEPSCSSRRCYSGIYQCRRLRRRIASPV
jgi:hypothetical protein